MFTVIFVYRVWVFGFSAAVSAVSAAKKIPSCLVFLHIPLSHMLSTLSNHSTSFLTQVSVTVDNEGPTYTLITQCFCTSLCPTYSAHVLSISLLSLLTPQVFVTVDNEGPTHAPVTKFFGLADAPSPAVRFSCACLCARSSFACLCACLCACLMCMCMCTCFDARPVCVHC